MYEFLREFIIITFFVFMFEWPALCVLLGSKGSGVYVEDK